MQAIFHGLALVAMGRATMQHAYKLQVPED
jgi:hypothetical protein